MPKFSMPDMRMPSFGDFKMPDMPSFPDFGSSFGNMENEMDHMRDQMAHMKPGNEGKSESFSSSFSSNRDKNGQVHTTSSKKGSETQCHGGKCETVVCKDGKCDKQ